MHANKGFMIHHANHNYRPGFRTPLLRIWVLAVGGLLVGGCTNIFNRDKTDFMSPVNPMSFRSQGLFKSNFTRFHEDMNEVAWLEDQYFELSPNDSTTESKRRNLRDHIAQILIDDFNLCWFNFSSSFQGRYGLFKSAADSTAGGLAAFAGVTPTQQTARLLSVGAATILGISSAVQKDFFEGNAAYIMLGQMDADRQQILASIRSNLTKSTDEYPLSLLVIDLWNYVNVMTVPHALTALNGKVGQQASQTQNSSYGQKQPDIQINDAVSPLSLTTGTAKRFTASGGAGTGSFEWNCVDQSTQKSLQKGSGNVFDLTSLTPGNYSISVFKDGDSNYAQSGTYSIHVEVKDVNSPSPPK